MFSLRKCGLLLGLTVLGALGWAVSAPAARADVIAYTITDTVGNAFATGGVTLGFEFKTNAAILVTQLGLFDSSQDGLAQSHDIGLWNSSGMLLVSATVPMGTAAPLTNQFRYVAVVPTLLAAGQNYDIGAFYTGGSDSLVGMAAGFATDTNIMFVGARGINGSSLADPTGPLGAGFEPGVFGPNFQFTTAAVPEPTTLTLLGFGTLGLLGYAWRWRKQAV